PIIALSKVTSIPEIDLSRMIGRQLPFFSLLIPFWVVWALAGFRGMIGVWPAALTAGLAFAIPQFLVSNFHGPWLVDIIASISSMAAVGILLKFWRPKDRWRLAGQTEPVVIGGAGVAGRKQIVAAWAPWCLLSALVFVWGIPQVKATRDRRSAPVFQVPALHNAVVRAPLDQGPDPQKPAKPEEAIFRL